MNSSSPKVRKAVVAVAGFGTRFLPMTRAIPKEMLPIIDKPIIQYIVEELAAGGIEEIIFVTNWQKTSIENHFDQSYELEHQLVAQGKANLVADMKRISRLAKFVYIRQVEGYGNALPLVTVRELIGDEPFIYAFADDLVKSTVPFSTQLIEAYHQHGCSIMGVQEVASTEVSKYGIVKLQPETELLETMVEKPTPEEAPSNLAVFGRYLFTPAIFSVLDDLKQGKGNEYWVTDAIEKLLTKEPVATRKIKDGRWVTTGDPVNYLEAILEYAKDRPELQEIIKNNC